MLSTLMPFCFSCWEERQERWRCHGYKVNKMAVKVGIFSCIYKVLQTVFTINHVWNFIFLKWLYIVFRANQQRLYYFLNLYETFLKNKIFMHIWKYFAVPSDIGSKQRLLKGIFNLPGKIASKIVSWKKGLLYKERICCLWEQILSLKTLLKRG